MEFKEGRVALVTGAGSKRGIGRAICLSLAKAGCDVIAADMDVEGAKETAALVEAMGRRSKSIAVDVSDEGSVESMVAAAIEWAGRIDILINNAGVTQPVTVLETTLADWNRIIAINLTGAFLCSRAVIPHMAKNMYGRIVNLSSVSGKRGGGVYGGAHYSAAKAGILGFSKALAREVVSSGITVNSVCPGLVATDIRTGFSMERELEAWKGIPMQRPATAQEIAYAVTFLASDGASYITGEDIDINGGSHMD